MLKKGMLGWLMEITELFFLEQKGSKTFKMDKNCLHWQYRDENFYKIKFNGIHVCKLLHSIVIDYFLLVLLCVILIIHYFCVKIRNFKRDI